MKIHYNEHKDVPYACLAFQAFHRTRFDWTFLPILANDTKGLQYVEI